MRRMRCRAGVCLLVSVVVVCATMAARPGDVPKEKRAIDWAVVRAQDVAVTTEEWGKPVYIEASDGGWEDSVFVTGDGKTLYFCHYPGVDLLADFASGNFAGDLDIYASQREADGSFRARKKDGRYFLSEKIWSETGPMVDAGGNIFYDSNRDYVRDGNSDPDIYRNDERLAFNGDGADHHGNPHYCAELDELYLTDDDKHIFVVKEAATGGFAGKVELAPAPINAEGFSSTQPFLTPDGRTMYFTTNRGDIDGVAGPAIYKSARKPDGSWGKPSPVIWGRVGVGEPTLTDDGKRLYFLQLFRADDGTVTSDMFYVERK